MAVTSRTLTDLRALSVQVGEETDQATRDLTAAWAAAWETLTPHWRRALAEAVAYYVATGQWPPPWQLPRLPAVAAAVTMTSATVDGLTASAALRIGVAVGVVAAATQAAEPLLIVSQLPATAGITAAVLAGAIAAAGDDGVLSRSRERSGALTRQLADTTRAHLARALTTPAKGTTPADIGEVLLDQVKGVIDSTLTAANTLVRTETLDAYRAVSAAAQRANAAWLDGWMWVSALQTNTCAGCWAMHGTVHELAESGPDDHPQGRCKRLPLVKPWARLGLPGVEPDAVRVVARERFGRLPEADQLSILGPTRLRLLTSGAIGWDELAYRRTNPGWRPSYNPTPVDVLQRSAQRRNAARPT